MSIEDEAKLESRAINLRLGVPAELIAMLDDAAVTGRAPSAQTIFSFGDPENGWSMGDWDGTVDGKPLCFAPAIGWCVIRDWYGWGLPTAESLKLVEDACAKTGAIIDFGAGSGYWSAVLKARGIDAIAVDDASARRQWKKEWTPVQNVDGYDVLRRNPTLPVLMSWPEPTLDGTLLEQHVISGNKVLRCGPRAFTGNSDFYLAVDRHFHREASASVGSAGGSSDDVLEVLVRNPAGVVNAAARSRQDITPSFARKVVPV